ncbi:MAG: aspartate/glutamate racemase family protein [Candidatus Cloacimonetes bacterium]|nr:aspartate/glutamate racemase family protein [Candidatus Cloacimonadota bacterium]MCF7814134.1 aspartate/glutamate racemase family protein [Candidatus Cloacimonadota bacterium]MCF7868717.1 aspartate/glutamate racemase family protein [Candidatus Cloacimonadota bacterium]MCF7884133.1 aspartate/glutamate racemase family protein [Candidatus Cloacimonadota bacterium]
MKTIGLIGGTTWESTKEYYRFINQLTQERLGGVHSAKLILYSVDFDFILSSSWEEKITLLSRKAKLLQNAGADCVLICANTLHKLYNEVQQSVQIPVIHIAKATGKTISEKGIKRVGLLGTRPTMEEDFYQSILKSEYGIETLIPELDDRKFIQSVIYKELSKGLFLAESKTRYLKICEKLISKGAEGIILGCTEIPLLISQKDLKVPAFDTAYIHASAAVEFALI